MSAGECCYCGAPIEATTAYRRVTGWERKGSSSSRRGGSDVVLREPTTPAEFACRWCVERLQRGVSLEQESLL